MATTPSEWFGDVWGFPTNGDPDHVWGHISVPQCYVINPFVLKQEQPRKHWYPAHEFRGFAENDCIFSQWEIRY